MYFQLIIRVSLHCPVHIHREENLSSLRALDTDLKEKLITWLSPAALELHQLTWNDSASLLEKIVAYEVLPFYTVGQLDMDFLSL